MELTTKTAGELLKLKSMLREKHSNFSNSIIQDNIRQIINFKNELNEILNDKNPDEPILKYYERMYIQLMTLKTEIESIENE